MSQTSSTSAIETLVKNLGTDSGIDVRHILRACISYRVRIGEIAAAESSSAYTRLCQDADVIRIDAPTPHGSSPTFGDHVSAWGSYLDRLCVEELAELQTLIDGARARKSGNPLCVWDGRDGDLCDVPPGGAVLRVDWAVSDHSYAAWYPTEEGALAELHALAKAHGRKVCGRSVDLTCSGCYPSGAHVTVRD